MGRSVGYGRERSAVSVPMFLCATWGYIVGGLEKVDPVNEAFYPPVGNCSGFS